ncbi:helix-hairpin-helix domain-containing protein [Paremcibacter congregatus]|uniref:helix-hairpin-helix domain-containing protein n=1 Tax=Paremcibacter congregatus TaxID=2043170 RepID=UPI003A8D5667
MKKNSPEDKRKLKDLACVGPATESDLHVLGIRCVEQLKKWSGEDLYSALCEKTGVQHNICCLDVFNCAVAQANDPDLPKEQCDWWYWTNVRKTSL